MAAHLHRYRPFTPSTRRPLANFRPLRLTVRAGNLPSWAVAGVCVDDGVGGWSEVEKGSLSARGKGLPTFSMIGVGASAVVLAAAFAFCKFSGKRFCSRMPFIKEVASEKIMDRTASELSVDKNIEAVYETASEKMKKESGSKGKRHWSIIPAVTDSTQQEALSVLKKLKIIEDEVVGDVLCTKRQYARWLVRMNYLLQRNPKHRLIPVLMVSASSVSAFSDVDASDTDFWSIQALAHAGIIPSKLTTRSSLPDDQVEFNFLPESHISRIELVSWKVQIEHSVTERIEEKISTKKMSYVDLSLGDMEAFPEILLDILTGDQSIISRVFGCSRRLQPRLPVTIAQVAVALTGGKMVDAVQFELSRLDLEKLSREIEKEAIKSEILGRGEISEVWKESLGEVKAFEVGIHEDLQLARSNLEDEKIIHYQILSEFLEEKTSLECEKRLLMNLKEEVNEMCHNLDCEKGNITEEFRSLEELSQDLLSKRLSLVETKAKLEAERKSVSMLRIWVEEEANQIGARTKVLEAAARRWKHNLLQGSSNDS